MMNNNTIISMCYLSKILDIVNNVIYIEEVNVSDVYQEVIY
jgi:hypothetical protein